MNLRSLYHSQINEIVSLAQDGNIDPFSLFTTHYFTNSRTSLTLFRSASQAGHR